MCTPASAVGDPPELLDIDVHQLARPIVFIADRCGLGGSDHLTGERVALVESRAAVAAQNPGDRACRDTDVGCELVGPAAALTTSGQHHVFDIGCSLVSDRVWSR